MAQKEDIHPDAPAGGGGPGGFASPLPMGLNPTMDKANLPLPLGVSSPAPTPEKLTIKGMIADGGELSNATIKAVNEAAAKTRAEWRRFIAYSATVKVGGSLAWRANNPGNLRDAPTKIGTVSGAVGKFAVFATMEDGRAAQRDLYLKRYGDQKVRDAINKLTPPIENDTTKYLADLVAKGVDLDKDVKSQIDPLMKGVAANEGVTPGTEVTRVP